MTFKQLKEFINGLNDAQLAQPARVFNDETVEYTHVVRVVRNDAETGWEDLPPDAHIIIVG